MGCAGPSRTRDEFEYQWLDQAHPRKCPTPMKKKAGTEEIMLDGCEGYQKRAVEDMETRS